MSPGLSVVIPCYNEEGNLAATIREVERALEGLGHDYELLVFNDGSTDGTAPLLNALAGRNPRVRAFQHKENRGLGYRYREGVRAAAKEYLLLVPGDNEITAEAIRGICRHLGEADIVIPFIENHGVRPLHRRALSRAFTLLMNTLTGSQVKYYNGPVLHRVANLRGVNLATDGFAYQAEILAQLLRRGATYVQVPMLLRPRAHGGSRALRPKNIFSVLKSLAKIGCRT